MKSRRQALALAGSLIGLGLPGSAHSEDPLPFGGPFELQAANGLRVRSDHFPGKLTLVLFGFTHCPDICPTSLASIAQAMKLLGPEAQRVQTLFITVDPARDTPELLAEYIGGFDPAFIGLSGSEAEVAAVAKLFRVHRLKVLTGADESGYTVDHSTLIYLVNDRGETVSIIPYGADGETIAKVVRKRLR
jgi:protein SCO1